MDRSTPPGPPPAPVTRAAEGRWLGGVCRGIADARGMAPARLRLAVLGLTLCGGIGAVLYLAAWLILPRCGSASDPGTRGIVVLAKALAGLAGLTILAAAGAAATVFGFGWIVFAVAAAALLGAVSLTRLGPGWALLPVAALTIPSAALAAEGMRLEPTDGARAVEVPARALSLRAGATYRSGLGTLLLDLRHTPLPHGGRLVLRIHAGIRRTIVALPNDECVHVVVHARENPFPVRVASLLTGRQDHAFADVFLLGSAAFGSRTVHSAAGRHPGPTLEVDFSSQGGSLYVRNYPDRINPDLDPYWPGFPVTVETRPDVQGLSRTLARRELTGWRARRERELDARREYDSLVGGPCTRPAHRRSPRRDAAAPAARQRHVAPRARRADHRRSSR